MDALDEFKERQKKNWAHFAPAEEHTIPPAARLVGHARLKSGQRVLDVACGTGVVAVTAARLGARVTGLDLTPELLDHARENAAIAEVSIDWHEGDAENLPFPDASFDAVVSQFGHIFAPRPAVVTREMLRVLKPGGTIAFSTWPPELCVGRIFEISARYLPPPPPGVSSPLEWGDPKVVRERLGDAVTNIVFDRADMLISCLSPQHRRVSSEQTVGPVLSLVAMLSKTDPPRLEAFRREYEAAAAEYIENNVQRQEYLMTRAVKA